MKLYFLFSIISPIFLDGILDYIICFINIGTMFTLDYGCIDGLYFWTFLEGIIKDYIKLLGWYFK